MFRNFFDPDNALMITLSQITDCILLSLLWLLGCFFVITAGASCSALYDAVFHSFRGSERNCIKRFLATFLRDLKASLIPNVLFLAALWFGGKGMIALWNGAVYGTYSWALFAGCALLALTAAGILGILFPLLSRFDNPLPLLLKNTLLLSLMHLPRTMALGLLNLGCAFLCLRFIYPLFFLPALTSLISTTLLEPMFKPYMQEK